MHTVDLNCDMGEGCGNDAELMKYISSANIACGFHAGDLETMRRTADIAAANNVVIGAHPGYRDRENFGRQPMSLSTSEIENLIAEQLSALKSIGATLHHVKPHGALYNQAARDRGLAASIAMAVSNFDPDLILYGLSGSHLISEGERAGLKTASEVFADRSYQADGTLTPRSEPGALITDRSRSLEQVLQMIETGTVNAITGDIVDIRADTICIHGDSEHAVEFAREIAQQLRRRLVEVHPPYARARA